MCSCLFPAAFLVSVSVNFHLPWLPSFKGTGNVKMPVVLKGVYAEIPAVATLRLDQEDGDRFALRTITTFA